MFSRLLEPSTIKGSVILFGAMFGISNPMLIDATVAVCVFAYSLIEIIRPDKSLLETK